MQTPWVGLVASILTALGLYGLCWYHSLSDEDRQEADRLAAQYAWSLYNKGVDQLTRLQMSRVLTLVKGHFAA